MPESNLLIMQIKFSYSDYYSSVGRTVWTCVGLSYQCAACKTVATTSSLQLGLQGHPGHLSSERIGSRLIVRDPSLGLACLLSAVETVT